MTFKDELLNYGKAELYQLTQEELVSRREQTIAKTFMRMWITLLLAFGVAYTTALWLLPLPFSWPLYWIAMIAWFGIVLGMSWKWQSMSYSTLVSLLLLFGLLQWYWLSGIFLLYSLWSISSVFLLTWGMFMVLAFLGYTFHIDISRVGTILFTALIVLIVASLINAFVGSSVFDLWISVFGVIIFSWLIVYDMQLLKQAALIGDPRMEVILALGLYLNFINLFLFLLRLVWDRN
jgi:FtsH-binding integral membrane protein